MDRHFQDKSHWWTFGRKTEILKWTLTFVTGLACGIVALLVTSLTQWCTHSKYRVFHNLLRMEKELVIPYGVSFVFLFLCNLFFGFIAWYMVYLEPMAAGSGIPEVKCYLNGLHVPRLLEMRTLLCKAAGIVFACSAGLPLGKEGPMVHIGAILAAGISQGKSLSLGVETTFSNFQDLRNDREKRDFVACGSAAGVAAAFGAPIGGVLFSLEEGASFWSTKLTWRAFFCAMTTVFFLYIFNTAKSLFGHSDITAMFSFGEFFSLQQEQSNYSVWELSLFVLIGYLGGLIGAFFNYMVQAMFKYRTLYVKSAGRKCLEMMVIVSVMSLISMALPLLWNKCTPLPVNMEGWTDEEKQLVASLNPLYCNAETQYNELASLYLSDSDTAIRQLFHFREIGDHNDSTFSSLALFCYFMTYIMMACVVCNTSTPAGMFVPSLLSGAAFGRLVGHLLHKLDNTRGTFADSGTYALMGAAAVSSGITRMTISLTVMILEATGDMQYVLPLMLTILTARLIGNIFTDGIYDMHIVNRQLHYLDEDEGFGNQVELHDLTVSDVMTAEPLTLPSVVTVGQVIDTLRKGRHHCFPIVDDAEPGVLQGTIARKVICTLLKHRAYSPMEGLGSSNSFSNLQDAGAPASRLSPLVNWGTLECIYPNYPDLEDFQLTDRERLYWLDLRPYLDASPFIINERASVQRTYRMFRTLGLRHLIVINKSHQLVGVVTRSDLVALHHISSHNGHSDGQRKRRARRAQQEKEEEEEEIEMALRKPKAIRQLTSPLRPSTPPILSRADSVQRRQSVLGHTISLQLPTGEDQLATSSCATESDGSEDDQDARYRLQPSDLCPEGLAGNDL